MPIQLVCQQCQQPFTVEKKDRNHVYCSMECYNETRKARVTHLTCAQCGEPFTQLTRYYRVDPHQFCSKACYYASYCPEPDLSMSEPLAYLLGVLVGDGCANRVQFIVQVADREFADECIQALESIGLRPTIREIPPRNSHSSTMWRVVASSVPLATWMSQLTVADFRTLITEPEHRRQFIRGFYESEGSVVQTQRKIRAPHARPQDPSYEHVYATTRLTMTNLDRELLALVQEWAGERGHDLTLRFSRKTLVGNDAFELVMTSQTHIELFLADIRPVIKRMPEGALPSRKTLLEIDGEYHSMAEWARRLGMHPDKFKSRLKRGWPIERAIIP